MCWMHSQAARNAVVRYCLSSSVTRTRAVIAKSARRRSTLARISARAGAPSATTLPMLLDHKQTLPARAFGRSVEIVTLFEIFDEAGVRGRPAEKLPGDGARCRHVCAEQAREHPV